MKDLERTQKSLSHSPDKLDPLLNGPSFETLASTDESSDDSQVPHRQDKKRSPFSRRSKKTVSPHHPRKEVISFGDSMEERTAVKIVSSQLEALPKSVMFVTSPSPEQLMGQLIMLTGHMKYICESKKSLDLEISPQQAEKCAASSLGQSKHGYERNRSLPRIRRVASKEQGNDVNFVHVPSMSFPEETFSL